MDGVAVRLMRADDLASAERASDEVFLDSDRRDRRVNAPEPEPRSEKAAKRWVDRMRYLLDADPQGCWVAADGERIVGFAISQNRDRLWYLATYGVLPGLQGHGIGKRLLDAVLTHAGDRQGMFSSSVHPGATRRYRLAGFSLHPQMRMVGTVDRSALPTVTGLSDGSAADFDWMDRLDQQVRGAGHGSDHQYLLNNHRLVVSRVKDKPGYVYIDDRGRPHLLAAADRRTAADLLWEALAAAQEDTLVNCITIANEWAVDVSLAAGLDIGQEGYLAVRGMPTPAPYLASGQFL
ncbi:GNAT family N-acetyltransferase [Nocardia sp. NPDC051052]|uniref:GNAT family N-acetyltransferase n=1 Tax=Nocardia sp. NPDC051052 TaxID=3364322 RepID=UPI0037A39F5D